MLNSSKFYAWNHKSGVIHKMEKILISYRFCYPKLKICLKLEDFLFEGFLKGTEVFFHDLKNLGGKSFPGEMKNWWKKPELSSIACFYKKI